MHKTLSELELWQGWIEKLKKIDFLFEYSSQNKEDFDEGYFTLMFGGVLKV